MWNEADTTRRLSLPNLQAALRERACCLLEHFALTHGRSAVRALSCLPELNRHGTSRMFHLMVQTKRHRRRAVDESHWREIPRSIEPVRGSVWATCRRSKETTTDESWRALP